MAGGKPVTDDAANEVQGMSTASKGIVLEKAAEESLAD
jgi:hypothetical protein